MFSVAHPWYLLGLFLLPLLWRFFAHTPPLPKNIFFPPTKLLKPVVTNPPPLSLPWWWRLLRVTALGLLILSLAEPTFQQKTGVPPKDIVFIIDNTLFSGKNFDALKQEADSAIQQWQRLGITLHILGLAPHPIRGYSVHTTTSAIKPWPWLADMMLLGFYFLAAIWILKPLV
jgi:Aerotolerance regulator N-terminal